MGPPKASNIPIAPKQQQHNTTITTTTITQVSGRFGWTAGSSGGVVMI
jgi:hypothetical protein